MKRLAPILLLVVAALAAMSWQTRQASSPKPSDRSAAAWPQTRGPDAPVSLPLSALPAEARDTLRLIRNRGPFPHRQDGQTFHNRERLLPLRGRGWYREYTVSTPGAGDRGARRIVTGGDPPVEFWYTRDHYRSFQRIDGTRDTAP